MNINGVNYDEYLASIAQIQSVNAGQTSTSVQTGTTESDRDSYIPSLASADAAIPSSTYGADGLETGLVSGGVTGTQSTADETEETDAAGGAGGAGGGGSSDSDEDTETELVTINGVTYLQTTTTDENGNTTVTRTQVGVSSIDDDK
jgi:hypothetical protein